MKLVAGCASNRRMLALALFALAPSPLRVVDSHGAPVAGADVYVTQLDFERTVSLLGKTDDRGGRPGTHGAYRRVPDHTGAGRRGPIHGSACGVRYSATVLHRLPVNPIAGRTVAGWHADACCMPFAIVDDPVRKS